MGVKITVSVKMVCPRLARPAGYRTAGLGLVLPSVSEKKLPESPDGLATVKGDRGTDESPSPWLRIRTFSFKKTVNSPGKPY